MPWVAVGQRDVFGAVDIGFLELPLTSIGREQDLVGKGLERVWVQQLARSLSGIQISVIDERFPPDWKRQHDRAVAPLGCNRIKQRNVLRREHVVHAFAVVRNKRVPVNEATNAIGPPIGYTSDDHAAVAVADENDVVEII